MRANLSGLDTSRFRFSFRWLALSAIAFFLHIAIQGLAWHRLSRFCGIESDLPTSFRIWSYSQLGKYVPGKIARLGYLVFAYEKCGAKIHQVTTLVLLEFLGNFTGMIILAAGCITWAVDTPDTAMQRTYVGVGAAAAAIGLSCLHPRILNSLLCLLSRLTRKSFEPFEFRYKQVLALVPFYTLSLFLLCLSNWLLFVALVDLKEVPSLISSIVIFGLANLTGWFAFFTPGGLGAREAVLQLGFQGRVGAPLASALTIASRVWFTLCELLFVAGVWAITVSARFAFRRRARSGK